jgi:hypothetical protein
LCRLASANTPGDLFFIIRGRLLRRCPARGRSALRAVCDGCAGCVAEGGCAALPARVGCFRAVVVIRLRNAAVGSGFVVLGRAGAGAVCNCAFVGGHVCVEGATSRASATETGCVMEG